MSAADMAIAAPHTQPAAAARRARRNRRIVLGLCLMTCLLVGGATQRGVLVEALLQVLVIAGSTYALMGGAPGGGSSAAMRLALVLGGLVLFTGIVQLLPLPVSMLEIGRPAGLLPYTGPTDLPPIGAAPISLSVARTIEAAIFALVPILFFAAASSLPKEDRAGLLPFFVIGLACNLIAAGLQYSFSGDTTLGDLLGYDVMVGMFANRNHFATLVFSSMPLIIYFGFFRGRPALATVLLGLIFLILLAAGSRAGILIGLGVVAISLTALIWRGRVGTLLMLALVAGVAAYAYGAFVHVEGREIDHDFGRWEFAVTTLRAIRDNWLWGTGFGSFDLVYPFYENRDMVHVEYVNHAHNDFLEILLEGGIAAGAILLVYVAALAARAFQVARYPLQRLALLSIIVILLHSLVDYPLRTMAIAMSFAFFNMLFFTDVGTKPPDGRPGRSSRGPEEILPPESAS